MKNRSWNVHMVMLCIGMMIYSLPQSVSAQNLLPEEVSQTEDLDTQVENFDTSDSAPVLNIPSDNQITYLETLKLESEKEQAYSLMATYEELTTDAAQEIITIYLGNGYSLTEVMQILQDAGFTVNEVFTSFINVLGDAQISDITTGLLTVGFNSREVFQVGISYLKSVTPSITDEQMVEIFLGEDVDAELWKGFTQEIFIQKIQSVGLTTRVEIVKTMINSGFTLTEISNALIDSGFSLEDAAKIFKGVGVYIDATYDLLIDTQGGQEFSDVFQALRSTGYDMTDLMSCVVNNLIGSYGVEEIIGMVVGAIVPDSGVTQDQINLAVNLCVALENTGITVAQIADNFLAYGFDLQDTALVLSDMGVGLDELYSTLVNAGGGQDKASVVNIFIANCDDLRDAYDVVVPDLMSDGYNTQEITAMIIGEIDADNGVTPEQLNNTIILTSVFLEQGISLEQACNVFLSLGVSLEDTACIVMGVGVTDEAQVYTLLINAGGGQNIANVSNAMIAAQYNTEEVLSLAVTDLKSQGRTTPEIINTLIGTVEEGKNPTATQVSNAQCLTNILLSEGNPLQEISEGLLLTGFSLDKTAALFKKAGVILGDAYNALFNSNGGQVLFEVCSALKSTGYNANDIYGSVLKAQGYSVSEIVVMTIGVVAEGEAPTYVQMSNSNYLIGVLLGRGDSLEDISNAFLNAGFGLNKTASVFKSAGVKIADMYTALRNSAGGQEIATVATALIGAGFNVPEVYSIVVPELKTQGYSVDNMFSMLIGEVDAKNGATGTQQTHAKYLLENMHNGGVSLQEICGAFLNAGFSLDNAAKVFKNANLNMADTFQALLEVNGGQDSLAVINALVKSGYVIGEVFFAIVPELKNQGHSTSQIITMLVGAYGSQEDSDKQLIHAIILAVELQDNGDSLDQICNAFLETSFSLERVTKIFKSIGVAFETIYPLLLNSGGGQDTSAVGVALLAAGYDEETVLTAVVADLKTQGYSSSQMINVFIGIIGSAGARDGQISLTVVLAEILLSSGDSLEQVSDALLETGFTLENAAKIFKGMGVAFETVYPLLLNSGGGQDTSAVGVALLAAGYDVEPLLTAVVADLEQEGYSISAITAIFIETVSSTGPTIVQLDYATHLANLFLDGGETLQDIADAYEAAGFMLENVVSIFKGAQVSSENAFTVLIGFGGGQDPVELTRVFYENGYSNADVFSILVAYLKGQEYSMQQLFTMVIGTIAEDGLTVEQKSDAKYLLTTLQDSGDSLEDITLGMFAAGIGLDNIAELMKKASVGLQDAFSVLLSNYVGAAEEVVIRSVTGSLIKGGYDSVDVYSMAVEKLNNDGITVESDVISILIGTRDQSDSQQIENAAVLSEVLSFNENKASATNTLESFLFLFNSGYKLEEINTMLIDNGYSQDEISATFNDNFNEIIKQLAKSGNSAAEIVALIKNKSNKAEYLRPLAEQLIRNNFGAWESELALYQGGVTYNDLQLIYAGIKDAKGYDITKTSEAAIVTDMIGAGNTITEISRNFSENGYQLKYVAKLFKAMGVSLEDTFAALSATQSSYDDGLLSNNNAVLIALLDIHSKSESDVFAVATTYYKENGMSAEGIVFTLSSAKVKISSNIILADTLVGQYYKSITILSPQSFITVFSAGYSITWIRDTLVAKGYTYAEIGAFIEDHDTFGEIYNGLRQNGKSVDTIARLFKPKECLGTTSLLAEFMIVDNNSEDYVRSLLLYFGAPSNLIEKGIANGLARL